MASRNKWKEGKRMNLKEKISEIFKGETDPSKLGELAGILNELDSLNATIAKQRDDNTKLANAYVNAISGVVDKSKPNEDVTKAPTVNDFDFDKAFDEEVAKMLGDK